MSKMLGISLSKAAFEGKTTARAQNDLIANHKNIETYLQNLCINGVESIEFRTLELDSDPNSYIEKLNLIWKMGFNLTVHIRAVEDFTSSSFVDIFPSAKYIIENFQRFQPELVLVVHALRDKNSTEPELADKTVKMLEHWAKILDREELPIKTTLENNRKKGIIDPGNSTEKVLEMVDRVDSPNVGIVWDMGHYYSNILVEKSLKMPPKRHIEMLPSDNFLRRVMHTHIHGLDESGTHNPLADYESLPIELYVKVLEDKGFKGIYNLELDPRRFSDKIKSSQGIYSSITRLNKSLNNHK